MTRYEAYVTGLIPYEKLMYFDIPERPPRKPRPKRIVKPKEHTCIDCDTVIGENATRCRPCNCKETSRRSAKRRKDTNLERNQYIYSLQQEGLSGMQISLKLQLEREIYLDPLHINKICRRMKSNESFNN